MKTIDIKDLFLEINFVDRYKRICEEFNDFENSTRGTNKDQYLEILESVNLKSTYHQKEKFFRRVDEVNETKVTLTLSLHDGLVEPMISFVRDNDIFLTPDGRWDFIPEKMGESFDRKKFNLPKFGNVGELKEILGQLSAIYCDLLRRLEAKDREDTAHNKS